MPEWARINAILLDAADGSDPFEGLSGKAYDRMMAELGRRMEQTSRISERLPRRAANDANYREKLHFATGRLVWLVRKREHIRTEKGQRAVAIVDALFAGILPGTEDSSTDPVPSDGAQQSRTGSVRRQKRTLRAPYLSREYRKLVAIWDRLEPRLHTRAGERGLTHGERLVHELFFRLDSEVQNGGVEQYLYNSAGDGAERAKVYLAEIGAWPTLEALDQASALFPDGVIPTNRRRRVKLLEKMEADREDFSNPLGEATARYAYAQPELYTRILTFANTHPDDFSNA